VSSQPLFVTVVLRAALAGVAVIAAGKAYEPARAQLELVASDAGSERCLERAGGPQVCVRALRELLTHEHPERAKLVDQSSNLSVEYGGGVATVRVYLSGAGLRGVLIGDC
jgi:hypothetical protein